MTTVEDTVVNGLFDVECKYIAGHLGRVPVSQDNVWERKLKNGREWTEELIIPLFWGHKCRQGVEPYVKKGVLRMQTLFTGSIMYNIKTPSSTIRGMLECAREAVRAVRGQYGQRIGWERSRGPRRGCGKRSARSGSGRHGDGVLACTWYGGSRTQCRRAVRGLGKQKKCRTVAHAKRGVYCFLGLERGDWRECSEGYRTWEAKRRPTEDGTGRKERLCKAQEARNNGRAGERERGGGSEKGCEYNKGKQNSSFGRVDGFADATSSVGRARTTRRMPTSGAARVHAGARADERGYSADDISFALGHWRPQYISDSGTSSTS
ncbi:hypothetical protein B0H17DRAFT_1128401 [Mycena rosella]|uniref:Uncharacterized protein n=1 Tax=Mycena rosella TaxID=1033263 RepID=A0AAD7DW28_MYCRO|nr:hypothetical protein B0H17DRAFT_1128401 [Mycena rosella]